MINLSGFQCTKEDLPTNYFWKYGRSKVRVLSFDDKWVTF